MADTDDEVMLSRSGSSNPYGKCTEEIKSKLPYDIKEGFARIAHECGMTESELLREMIMVKVLGVEAVRKIYEQRLNAVV